MRRLLFNQLPKFNQYHYVSRFGSFVCNRKLEDQTVFLYSLHSFFVEIWRDKNDDITKVITFSDLKKLKSYLETYI